MTERSVIVPIFEAWGRIYRQAMGMRFNRLARGGNDKEAWAPLKESTIKRRRKGKGKKRNVSILIDSGTLWSTLEPTFCVDGQLQLIEDRSITVGISGGAHPGGMTIGKLAGIHHFGTKRIPARPILVEPDERTKKQMGRAMEIGLRQAMG